MTLPTAPPTSPRDVQEVELLLQFVQERDVHCPRCDYNLRNLTQPVCPECREDLHLAVGLGRPKFGWLIATLAPGIFSGIAAFFMAGMLIVVNLAPTGKVFWQPYVLDAFGWLSGITALLLYRYRYRFLRQLASKQMAWAATVWFVHVAFFVVMWTRMR